MTAAWELHDGRDEPFDYWRRKRAVEVRREELERIRIRIAEFARAHPGVVLGWLLGRELYRVWRSR